MNASVDTSPNAVVKANFPVRRLDLTFEFEDADKYWFYGNPWMTHFMNNLSSLFPYGEKFFVDSVRELRDQVKNPQLQKDISAFIGQEAMHSKEHATYNEYVEKYNVDLHTLEERSRILLEVIIPKITTAKSRLALTCALEHYTASMAATLLSRPDMLLNMNDPKMFKLWAWHAIEENEHKSVCYDTYTAVGGGYFRRAGTMLTTTILFICMLIWFQLDLLRKDKQLFNWSSWKTGLRIMFGRNGYVWPVARFVMDYFRPGFHPTDHDTHALEARWRDVISSSK